VTVNPDVATAAQAFFAPGSRETLSQQLTAIRHIVALLLGAHSIDDSEIETFVDELQNSVNNADRPSPRTSKVTDYLPVTDAYAPSSAGGAMARYVFVEAVPGHEYLYDLFGDLPGSSLIKYSWNHAWGWDPASIAALREDLAIIYRSIGPSTRAVFFLSLDPALCDAQSEPFLQFVSACPVPVHGILHRMPQTTREIEMVQRMSRMTGRLCFLSETMAEQARSVLGLSNVSYLPHHPTSYAHPCPPSRREALRIKLGVQPGQFVFSAIGEARQGKGIDLLMSALEQIPIAARGQIFFLVAGKARHYNAQDLRSKLVQARTAGAVVLREHADEARYAVLTEREYSNYVAVSDVGLLLYQDGQRHCMSGVLGDYVWAGLPVIATERSYTGAEVQRNDLGLLLSVEDPKATAVTLVEALRLAKHHKPSSPSARAYRDRIAPEAVLEVLRDIVDPESESTSRQSHSK